MSHDILRHTVRIGFGTLALLAAAPTLAADLAYPPADPEEPAPTRLYREERVEEEALPPQSGPAPYGPRFAAGPRFAPPPPAEECRTIVKRRIDAYGEEVVRRVRICDEAASPPPRPRYRPSVYDPGPPPHTLPLPPAGVPGGRFEEPPRW